MLNKLLGNKAFYGKVGRFYKPKIPSWSNAARDPPSHLFSLISSSFRRECKTWVRLDIRCGRTSCRPWSGPAGRRGCKGTWHPWKGLRAQDPRPSCSNPWSYPRKAHPRRKVPEKTSILISNVKTCQFKLKFETLAAKDWKVLSLISQEKRNAREIQNRMSICINWL